QSPFKQSASYAPLPALIEAMAVERSEQVPSLRQRRPDAPWDLESILRKSLDPNPPKRYQRPADPADDLDAYLGDGPLRHAPRLSRVEAARKWVRRHPRVTSSGGVAVVAAALLATAGATLLGLKSHLLTAQTRLGTVETKLEAADAHEQLRKHD